MYSRALVTVKLQEPIFPKLSLTERVTVVSPGGNNVPSGRKPTGGLYHVVRGVLGSDTLYSPSDALSGWMVFGVDGLVVISWTQCKVGGVVSRGKHES